MCNEIMILTIINDNNDNVHEGKVILMMKMKKPMNANDINDINGNGNESIIWKKINGVIIIILIIIIT